MSGRYVLEPPTSGKVILRTTHGEIHIELWTREAPLCCRNFIQLCLEGQYDNCPFYRVILGFLIQCGPEASNDSIYGGGFKDEFHSRLQFSHRGIVAMVNSKSNDNRSHFFITTDKASFLDKKNTIFGKVSNNTIYNVIKISESEVDPNDRPIMMPRILSTEIIVSPFEDIVPRELNLIKSEEVQVVKADQKRKVILKYDEEDEGDTGEIKDDKRIVSLHDALEDPKLSKSVQAYEEREKVAKEVKARRVVAMEESESDEEFDLKMKKKVLAKKEIFVEEKDKKISIGNYSVSVRTGQTVVSKIVDPDKEFSELKRNLLKLKRNPLGTNNPSVQQATKDEETFLSPLQKLKYNFYLYNKKTKGREGETLSKLKGFMDKIKIGDQKKDWYGNKLKFSVDSARAFGFNTRLPSKVPSIDDELIVDPVKRLKKHQEEEFNPLEQALSIENLMKITLPND